MAAGVDVPVVETERLRLRGHATRDFPACAAMWADPEVGWVLASAAAGRGYATEAVGAALAWGDVHLAASRTVCIIAPGHDRSSAVARKLGYMPTGSCVYGGALRTVLSRPIGGGPS